MPGGGSPRIPERGGMAIAGRVFATGGRGLTVGSENSRAKAASVQCVGGEGFHPKGAGKEEFRAGNPGGKEAYSFIGRRPKLHTKLLDVRRELGKEKDPRRTLSPENLVSGLGGEDRGIFSPVP